MNELEISRMSPGPYEWAIIPEGPSQRLWLEKNLDLGSGDVHMIWLPKHPDSVVGSDPDNPEHAAIFCMTGNGPNSKNNALALLCLLNHREAVIAAGKERGPLPIPTTPDAVAWAEWATLMEHALGISPEIPERLKNWRPA